MPTRKIADLDIPCRHPEHNPPSHMVYENGHYEHECPACGRKTRFTVSKPFCGSLPTNPTTLGDVWISNTRPTAGLVSRPAYGLVYRVCMTGDSL